MSHFNYRVMYTPVAGYAVSDHTFGIYEVYYDEDGKVESWSENPISLWSCVSDGIQSLITEADRIKVATTLPILHHHDGSVVENYDELMIQCKLESWSV
jgi:hypothetical protein